jgi:hypothetical protein
MKIKKEWNQNSDLKKVCKFWLKIKINQEASCSLRKMCASPWYCIRNQAIEENASFNLHKMSRVTFYKHLSFDNHA